MMRDRILSVCVIFAALAFGAVMVGGPLMTGAAITHPAGIPTLADNINVGWSDVEMFRQGVRHLGFRAVGTNVGTNVGCFPTGSVASGSRTCEMTLHEEASGAASERMFDLFFRQGTSLTLAMHRTSDALAYLPILVARTNAAGTDTEDWRWDASGNVLQASGRTFRAGGQITVTGTAPTVSACGTSPSIVGTDVGGKATVGTTPGASCLVTFAAAWTNAPACLAGNETTANLLRATSTTTTVTLAGTLTGGDVLAYVCIGRA